jgi:hypothetical protein
MASVAEALSTGVWVRRRSSSARFVDSPDGSIAMASCRSAMRSALDAEEADAAATRAAVK